MNDHVAEPFRSALNSLGGDNKMQNSPAEIYANVRNRALDEAAALLEGWDCPYAAIAAVRALKTEAA